MRLTYLVAEWHNKLGVEGALGNGRALTKANLTEARFIVV